MKYLLKNFIGQKRIIKELSSIIRNNPKNINILLKADAGMGKTHLAKLFLEESCKTYVIQYPSSRNKYRFEWIEEATKYRGHFIDEVHNIKNFEEMYPIMDELKYYFIFASNDYGELPEAFLSRCFVYLFDDYDSDEIADIVLLYSKKIGYSITKSTAKLIAERSRNNPRIAESYLKRVSFMIRDGYYKKTISDIKRAFEDIGIYKGGYTYQDIRYLQFLNKRGIASLNTISRGISIDKNTIQREIEPFLLINGHIDITSRGRKFVSFKQKDELII